MIQRGLSLQCSPATSLPTRGLKEPPWLICFSSTLDLCFTFQLFFCYAFENLVLLVMVITVKTNILIFCSSSCNLSMKNIPNTVEKDYIHLFWSSPLMHCCFRSCENFTGCPSYLLLSQLKHRTWRTARTPKIALFLESGMMIPGFALVV